MRKTTNEEDFMFIWSSSLYMLRCVSHDIVRIHIFCAWRESLEHLRVEACGLIQLLILKGYLNLGGVWSGVIWRPYTKKTCVEKRLDFGSVFNNHSRCNSQLSIGEGLYDHLITQGIFILTMNMIFIQAPTTMKKVVMGIVNFEFATHQVH